MNNAISSPPESLFSISQAELFRRIEAARSELGDSLLILGHHYQRDEILCFADQVGDSFALAKIAVQASAPYIVFCGVHFMAETADAITAPDQMVFIPDVTAGCFLADCAAIEQVQSVWAEIRKITTDVIPITYINSSLALKEFTGRNGGIVCTSSNASKALAWGWQQSEKIFFFPDQHLGRNSALIEMGISPDRVLLWDFEQPLGGHTREAIRAAKLILWNGYCDVHQEFTAAGIDRLRKELPGIRIVVHPECSYQVCYRADYMGSTARIIQLVTEAPPGSKWGIGTEKRLVRRLMKRFPDKVLRFIDGSEPECGTMSQITPVHLLWQLENLVDGRMINRIAVSRREREQAAKAIHRMLSLK